MKTLKQTFKAFLFLSFFISFDFIYAKTIFVANHANDGVAAYKTESNQLEFQKTIDLPTNGWGPSDITIDPTSGILFVTNENSTAGGGNVIELIQARTFLRAGSITLTTTSFLICISISPLKMVPYTTARKDYPQAILL